jgi:hypothetical protein
MACQRLADAPYCFHYLGRPGAKCSLPGGWSHDELAADSNRVGSSRRGTPAAPIASCCNGPTAVGTIIGSTRNDSHYALVTSPPRRRQRPVTFRGRSELKW